MKKLLIVDGNSILNRAFYGIRPLSTKEGIPTNAIYGMLTILKRHLDHLKPEYAVVAFDLRAKTFRHKAHDFYKAQRKPMPEELALQLPYAKEAVKSLGFNVIELEGYEADDVIGTVSRIAMQDMDIHSYILTGDRDSLQLINPSCSVILVKTKEDILYDTDKFIEDFGITPTQYIDVKAIMGDSSDNIPGINGIGEKGAFKLIADFGSLDAIYEGYKDAKISDGLKLKLENGKEMAYISKFLATIVCDAPIERDIPDFEYRGIDAEIASDLFLKLEFESLIKKFNIVFDPSKRKPSSPSVEPEKIKNAFEIGVLDDIRDETVAIYYHDKKLYIYTEKYNFYYDGLDLDAFLKGNRIICHDLKAWAREYNFDCFFDVMLASYLVSPSDASYELENLCIKYLNTEFVPEHGAQLIYELYKVLDAELENINAKKILTDIEMPLAKVLTSMEKEGFRVDTSGLASYGEELASMAEAYQERIYMLAGEEFNINSPKQLGIILFEKLGLSHGKKNKSGGYSTDAHVLEDLRSESPIIDEILEYRQLMKLKSTYCEGLLKVADENGRIHSTFNQTVTVTGRLSSSEPNLQNIPIRTELGRRFRQYFITKSEDYLLVDADYSQIELKVLAHLSGDANMIYAFNSGMDIHTMTASQVFNVPLDMVTPELRKRAKAVNFGIVYGIGDFSLAKDLHITKKEAKAYIDTYFLTYPDVHNFIKGLIESAKEKGYAETMFGRRRYVPEIESKNYNIRSFGERVAMNSPIQGSAADIIKIAMIRVYNALKKAKIDARIILQVHDELILEAHKTCADEAKKILQREMEAAVELLAPLTADAGIGATWLDAK
ncbi:MAG: DNA polymerase I [Clostridia bacterium]|nr:DNA polymerase I [Clostridia bacterium]